jgi:hypothetical protein
VRRNNPDEGALLLLALSLLMAVWALTALDGCSSVIRSENPLLKQVLKYRPGHQGLTHHACTEIDGFGNCKSWVDSEKDPRDIEVRKQLIDLGFRCLIGGKRYKLDPDAPQYVRYKTSSDCWLFCKSHTDKVDPIPMDPAQRFIDSGTECYSEQAYPDGIYP